MKLTEQEIEVVNIRFKRYRNLYREVFDELYDHILSLIELQRNQGDHRDITILLQEVIDTDFEGDRGLHRIALRRFTLFRSGLWNELWEGIKQNRVPFWIVGVLILLAGYFVPYSIQLSLILIAACFTVACLPLGYLAYLKGLKNIFYKKSIKLSTIVSFATYPIGLFNAVFCISYGVARLIEGHARECPIYLSGFVLLLMLAYAIGFIRFCNQEFKMQLS